MTDADVKNLLSDVKSQMQKALEHYEYELSKIRAGKASPMILEGINAEAYGAMTPINQLANVTTPDARTISIQPWDSSVLAPIEKAILMANIGLTPQNDGKIIRLNIPPLTEERRKDLVKQVKNEAEECRISLRSARRDANEKIKKMQKDGLPEDSAKDAETQVQNTLNDYSARVDKHIEVKEKEIMTV
ncbi:MAG: ribosome recycling factor [Bacteroidetes bacterium]|nr:ribosome recycling factor [Bacteroidota bacterium]